MINLNTNMISANNNISGLNSNIILSNNNKYNMTDQYNIATPNNTIKNNITTPNNKPTTNIKLQQSFYDDGLLDLI